MNYSLKSIDKELIEGCRRRDRLAQKYLYERFYGKMLGISMRYTKDREEADDVLNRSFLKIFDSFEKYEHQGTLSGWIAKIVFNTSIDFIRQRAKYQEVMDFNIEKEIAIEAEVIKQLFAEDLFHEIQKLPDTTRTIFSLFVIDGYKHREIAELLKISANTSKWHLAMGKKQLREVLKSYNKSSLTYEK